MKLFDIFDKLGNNVGEVHEAGPDLNAGCFGAFFCALIGILAPIFIWVALFQVSFSSDSSVSYKMRGVASLIVLLLNMIVHICILRKKKSFSFTETWSGLIFSGTFIAGSAFWLVEAIIDGSIRLSGLFASMLIFFLLSVGAGLAGAVIVMISRKK